MYISILNSIIQPNQFNESSKSNRKEKTKLLINMGRLTNLGNEMVPDKALNHGKSKPDSTKFEPFCFKIPFSDSIGKFSFTRGLVTIAAAAAAGGGEEKRSH